MTVESLYDYELRLTKQGLLEEKPFRVRAPDWVTALELAYKAAPPRYRDGQAFLTSITEVVADAARAHALERRVHELEQSLAESNSQVEIEREAAVGMAATIDAQADQIGVLNEAFNRQGHALTAIWQLSDDDTAAAAKDAARRILDADPTGFTSIPTETKEV